MITHSGEIKDNPDTGACTEGANLQAASAESEDMKTGVKWVEPDSRAVSVSLRC